MNFFVIARELCDRGDPVDNKVARMRACINLLDCFATLAMTRECGRYSFHVIARELCDRGDPVDNKVARMRACIIYWIASLRRAMNPSM